MIRRSLSTAAVSLLLAVAIAPVSLARDLEPGEAQWVLTPADVKLTGKVDESFTNALGPSIPQSCTSLSGQGSADGRESLSTIFGEVRGNDGTTWQSSVWTYKTPAAARRSYDQLKQRSLARCNDLYNGLIGDDVPDMPAVQNQRSAVLPKSTAPRSRFQRFFSANTTMLLDPAKARPGYEDTFEYATFALVGNAIVQVNMFQNTPVTPAQRTMSARVLNAISARYAASL
ncbi:MAG: hypothetical protein ACO3YU_08970 [Candidatus Nanopelagicales bacterium]